MRRLCAWVMVAGVIGLSGGWAAAQEYDGCNEQFYDSVEEECGGGHQHNSGKRDEVSLERSRHRHRYLEDQIKQLTQKVSALSAEVDQLKKAAAK